MKCICINLTKYVKDMYAETIKYWLTKSKKAKINGEHTVYKDWKIPHSKDYIFPIVLISVFNTTPLKMPTETMYWLSIAVYPKYDLKCAFITSQFL